MNDLVFWTIYENPSDYPGKFVVRTFRIEDGKPKPFQFHGAHETLEQARQVIPPGLYNIGRVEGDDPVILETWL